MRNICCPLTLDTAQIKLHHCQIITAVHDHDNLFQYKMTRRNIFRRSAHTDYFHHIYLSALILIRTGNISLVNDSTHCSTKSAQAGGHAWLGGMCDWGRGCMTGGMRGWGVGMSGRVCMAGVTHAAPCELTDTCKNITFLQLRLLGGKCIFTEETCSIIENQQVTLEVRVSAPCKTDVNEDPDPADVF